MTTPFLCLFIVAMIPSVLSMVGGYFRHRQLGSVDNKNPRRQYAEMSGPGARTFAAQQNAWEALGLFTAALFVATVTDADPGKVAVASIIYVVVRVLHAIFYIADKDMLRSLIYLVGLVDIIYLFFA